MSTADSFRGERCGVDNCRSRRYHLSDQGYYECDLGHVHPEIPVRGEDEDDFGPSGRVTRSSSGSEAREKVFKHFSGRKGFELYLQCYQLVLWKQCHFLVKSKGFPADFEVVVHDLWTLRIQYLKSRVEDLSALDSETESQSQVFSSETEEDNTQTSSTQQAKNASSPRVTHTLGMLYLASVLLRLPMLPSDLLKWANDGELLYYAALQTTPADMRARLPSTYHEALEPMAVLTHTHVYASIKEVCDFFRKETGMHVPSLNFPLLCIRCVQELAVPLPVYAAATELKKLLGYELRFEDWDRGRATRLTQASSPVAQLASLLVVATKLFHPFDGIERTPRTNGDLGAMTVDWDAWVKVLRDPNKLKGAKSKKGLSFLEAMEMKEEDAMIKSAERLDSYMEWYAANWTNEDVDPGETDAEFRGDLLAMFPSPYLPNQPPPMNDASREKHDIEGKIKAVIAAMQFKEPVQEDATDDKNIVRPGAYYARWRRKEDLNPHAQAFVEQVVEVIGIPEDRLIRAVFYTENKLFNRSKEEISSRSVEREEGEEGSGS